MKKLLAVIFVLCFRFSFAQSFQTILGPGNGNSMVQSLDGGFVITGWQGPYVLLTKADSAGNLVWTKYFGSTIGMNPNNKGFDIILLQDGGFLLSGFYNPSSGINDAYFIRTDQNGDTLWTKIYPSPYSITDEYYFYKVRQNSFGEFIAAGQIEYDSSQPFDISLMKLDSSGNQIWHKEIDLGKKETFRNIAITDSSYSIIGESYILNSAVHDHFILRTDTSGNLNFSRLYSQSPCCDQISGIIIKDNQNYVIVGDHNDSMTSYIDFFEFDSGGDTLLYNSIPNPLQIPISGFFRHTNGYILYGYRRTGFSDDAFVIKVDSAGNEIWRKLYGGNGDEELYTGIETSNGMLAFAGSAYNAGITSVYLIVADTSGSIISNLHWDLKEEAPLELLYKDNQVQINCDKNLVGPFEICIYNLLGEKVVRGNGYSASTFGLTPSMYIIVATDFKKNLKLSSRLLITNFR